MSLWQQQQITLNSKPRGFHLITHEILAALPQIRAIEVGLVHLLIQHTSAGLCLNENADPSVRADLNQYIDRLVPENCDYFTHTYEGSDDMPAHIKASLIGTDITLPIGQGQLLLGQWQGIYLGEFRNNGNKRKILATIQGKEQKLAYSVT